MNRIKVYLNSLGRGTRVLLLSLAVIFVGAGIAQASTTISTLITTSGALNVMGISTFGGSASTTIAVNGTLTTPAGTVALFLGGASTTQLRLLSGDTIKNTAASTTEITGNLTVGGSGVTGSTLTVSNGTAALTATSTVTAGCVVTTATSTETKVRLMFNTVASSTVNVVSGATVNGFVLWAYGSTCP